MIKETLEEIDWCLLQLERMQSFKTISDPATTKVRLKLLVEKFFFIFFLFKFRQLLNKELTQYGETDQIKQFISQTYLGKRMKTNVPNLELIQFEKGINYVF